MPMPHRPAALLLLIVAICLPLSALAAKFRVNNSPPPGVMLSIGPAGQKVAKVSFRIKSGELGNGTVVRGRPDISIRVANRATPDNSRMAVLTVDSSIPLRNGNHVTPFTSISWTAIDNNIPSGRYDGSSNQYLLSFPNSQEISDRHRFYYDNTGVLEAGTYTGQVIYTLTMP